MGIPGYPFCFEDLAQIPEGGLTPLLRNLWSQDVRESMIEMEP
jgi:hypothetical protein